MAVAVADLPISVATFRISFMPVFTSRATALPSSDRTSAPNSRATSVNHVSCYIVLTKGGARTKRNHYESFFNEGLENARGIYWEYTGKKEGEHLYVISSVERQMAVSRKKRGGGKLMEEKGAQ